MPEIGRTSLPRLTIRAGNIDLTTTDTNKLLLPLKDDAAAPTLAFGAATDGLYQPVNTKLAFSIGGVKCWNIVSGDFFGQVTNSGDIRNVAATATVPSLIPGNQDQDTGVGRAAADAVSLIAGGVEGIRITEATTIQIEHLGHTVFARATLSDAGPTDNVNVAGVDILLLDTSSNNVTIGGFIGGVDGQILHIVKTSTSNTATLEDSEGTGNQDMLLYGNNDRAIGATAGGWTLLCDGTSWYDVFDAG